MKYLSIILFISLTLISCKKSHIVTIQAQNLNNVADGSHYANMAYVVLERGYTFSSKATKLAEGALDENGYTFFDLKMKKNRDYVLGIQEPDNVCYTEITIEHPINYNETNTINFNYTSCGNVIIPTNNINCEGINDTLRYKYYYTSNPDIYIYKGFTHGDGLSWNSNSGTPGCLNYPGFYNKIPSGDYTMEWVVERPSGTITGIDYFTITENDTTTYVLEY